MDKFFSHPVYISFVFFVIMPMNGIIMTKNPLLGIGLCLMQLRWFYSYIICNKEPNQ